MKAILVYIVIWVVFFYGLFKRPSAALFLFMILLAFPQFWYPSQRFPLGSLTLTLLAISAYIGSKKTLPPSFDLAPNRGIILVMVISSYLSFCFMSLRFNLPFPISGSNPMMATWKNYALMLLLYFITFNVVRTMEDVKRVLFVVFGVLLLMSWREMMNFAAGSSFTYDKRSVGPFFMVGLGANHFAAFVAHFAAVAVGLFAIDRHKWRRRLYLATVAFSLYPIFYSYSRASYIAILMAILIIAIVRYRILIPFLVVFLLVWDMVLPASVVDRIQMTESPSGVIEESAALRLVVWQLAKTIFQDNPVIGIGYQGFFFASDGLQLRNPHNYFWQMAAEQGVVGVLILVSFLIIAAYSGWRLFRGAHDDMAQGLGLGFFACIAAVTITNIFGDRFSQLPVGGYLFILLAAVDRAWIIQLNTAPAEHRNSDQPEDVEKQDDDHMVTTNSGKETG